MKNFLLALLFAMSSAASAKTYYVSPNGNSTNNGLTIGEAWSVSKANEFSFNGDTIILSGSLQGAFYFGSDDFSSPTHPIVFRSNGEKANIGGIRIYNLAGIEIRNVNIVSEGIGSIKDGISFYKDIPEALEYIKIDSVEVSGYKEGSGIIIGNWESPIGYLNVTISNSIAHDNGKSGIETWAYYDHYCHKNIVIINCKAYNNLGITSITNQNTGSGILLSGIDGALVEKCTAYNNGANNRNSTGGPVGIWFYNVKNGIIRQCESFGNKAGLYHDGGGFDIDGGSQNCVIENCISHDNEGPGYLLAEYGSSNAFSKNIIRNNISTNDGLKNNIGVLTFYSSGSDHSIVDAIIENNVFFIYGSTPAINFAANHFINTTIRNNIFYVLPTTTHIQGDGSKANLSDNVFITTTVLPATLLTFRFQQRNKYTELQWKFANEANVSHYEIQKRNSNQSFKTIFSKVVTPTRTTSTHSYADAMDQVSQATYYRLKIVFKDGSTSYSEILFVPSTNPTSYVSLHVTPNPVKHKLIINLYAPGKERILLTIVNGGGATVAEKIWDVALGPNQLLWDELGSLSRGIYWLVINSPFKTETYQFVKE